MQIESCVDMHANCIPVLLHGLEVPPPPSLISSKYTAGNVVRTLILIGLYSFFFMMPCQMQHKLIKKTQSNWTKKSKNIGQNLYRRPSKTGFSSQFISDEWHTKNSKHLSTTVFISTSQHSVIDAYSLVIRTWMKPLNGHSSTTQASQRCKLCACSYN